jgi:SAM-dependent methyltransferase
MTAIESSTAESNAPHRAAFGTLSYAQWLRVLVRSLHDPVIGGVPMPAFPPLEYQVGTHGTSGRVALAEAGRFVETVDRYAVREGRPIGESTRVLDFGCGWGRMLRFWLNRVDSQNLHGVDVRDESVAMARRLNPFATFSAVDAMPPMPFDDESFDVVVAYSVFSHLSEAVSRAWITELARVLKPAGLAIVTTQGRGFIDFVESLSTRPIRWRLRLALGRLIGRPWSTSWLRSLREGFGDTAAARRRFADGQFVHAPTGGGDGLAASFYGESVVPRTYVEREWTDLELVDFVDESRFKRQAVIVLRKPVAGSLARR